MAQRVHQLALAALLAAGAVLLAGCQKPAGDLMAEARSYQQKGEKKAAQIQLKNLLEKEPNNAEARFLLASLALELGDVTSAEKEVRRALALKYRPDDSLALLSKVLLAQGKFQKVLDETAQVKDKPAFQILRGDALINLRKLQEAQTEYRAALQANPGNPEALTGLARFAALNHDLETATRLNDEALAKDERNIAALQFRATLLSSQGKPEEARKTYEAIIQLQPDNRNAHIENAMVAMAQGQLERAQGELDTVRKSGGEKNAAWIYAQALLDFTQGRYAASRDRLAVLLKALPQHAQGHLLAGAAHFQLGSLEQAEIHTRAYVDRDGSNVFARKQLAAIHLRAGKPAQAILALGPYLGDKEADAGVLALAGEAMSRQGDHAKAAGYLQQAVTLDPNNAQLRTALGQVRLAMGDRATGISELERAVALDPKSLQAGLSLARARFALREPDKALAALQPLEAQHANNALLHSTRGLILFAKRDYDGARVSFEKALKIEPNSFSAVYNLARLDLRTGNAETARKRLETHLATDKDNVLVMSTLGQLAEDRGDWDVARSWFVKAAAVKPDVLDPALRLARFDLLHGRPGQAALLLRKLQPSNQEHPILLDLLSSADEAGGQYAQALETMSKLAAVAPTFALPQYRMAMLHMQMRNQAAAQRALEKALAVEPTFYPAQLMQADLALARGDVNQVLAILHKLQKQFPKNPGAFAAEGEVLMLQRKAQQAVPLFERAVALGGDSYAAVKLADALRLAGHAREADEHLAQWRKRFPRDPVLVMHAGETYMVRKQYREAVAEFERVVQLQPGNGPAWNNLAYAYQQVKDPRALKTAEQALAIAGENAAVLDTLGWMLIEQGQLERGLPLLRRAAVIAPAAGDIRYHLAYGLNRSGEKLQARKELKQALANGNNFVLAEDARALLKQLE